MPKATVVPEEIHCSVCHKLHLYVRNTFRGQKCIACYKTMRTKCVRARRELLRVVPSCIDCSCTMPLRIGKGSWRERCEQCHRKHLRELDNRRYYERRRVFVESILCADCNSVFDRTGRGGPIPKRCGGCTELRQRDADRAHCSNRRARKLGHPYEMILPAHVYERDSWTCGICRGLIEPALVWPHPGSRSIDHIKPLSRGGHHTLVNVQAAHLRCNLKKACKHEDGEAVA